MMMGKSSYATPASAFRLHGTGSVTKTTTFLADLRVLFHVRTCFATRTWSIFTCGSSFDSGISNQLSRFVRIQCSNYCGLSNVENAFAPSMADLSCLLARLQE
ncbi:hypothetical protein I3760_07G117400 [Carya illinoinensis]|uniref:Uncharacterized protein n=1 Tax=Carya illinoinensis TaxID=32201 RepID=A0A922EJP7_CARIL|nr:hypothetical protein I3760_07G117400 [Carya illinoinensis]KAG6704155.1 hypothetical protein I3842_07G121900 [Carya illinoinensis]